MAILPIAVVIPTMGRPGVLTDTLASISRQTLMPDQLIVSASCAGDLPDVLPAGIETIIGPPGSCRQRNVARSRLHPEVQLVFLLDDDLELAPDYMEQMARVFREHPEIGLLGGNVIVEGVGRTEARHRLAQISNQDTTVQTVRALYGCNMCVRADIFRLVDFDENLPLMGWLEDFDWSVRAGRHGAIMHLPAAQVAHLKVNTGRASGCRFGYAQVINPYYLHRKGTIPQFREVLERHWLRLVTRNLVGLIRGDMRVDRWGRLRGNLRAFADILRRRSDPRRIEFL